MPHVATTQRVLPDLNTLDSDRLKALIVEQHFQLVSHDDEIENLKLLILKLKRMQFGPSSERLARHIDQLELRLEDLEANRASKPMSSLLNHSWPLQSRRAGHCQRSCRVRPKRYSRKRMCVQIVTERWTD